MLSPQILAFAFALAPSLVSAALFPPDSLVKVIDAKGFKKAMKTNETSLVAFVAPWCGHCQNLVPEYNKVALGLYPLVPTYAVDCDAEKNKQLCAEQGVQGFPTIKVFPRGNSLPAILYDDRRTSSAIYYFVIRMIPKAFKKIFQEYDISPWVEEHQSKPRAFLLRKDKKTPLLWQVLANKYQGQVEFATIPDRKGKISVKIGLEAGEKKVSKVLLYPAGSTNFIMYEGIQKLDSLSKFLDSVLDGTADLSEILEESKAEEFVIDDKELEIEKQQEAQRIALMHGGFNSLIDFEKAVKDGAGANYHDAHGYAGVMGGIPDHLKKKKPSDAPSSSETEGQTATPSPSQKDEVVEEQVSDAPSATTISSETEGHTATPHPAKKEGEVVKEQVSEQVVLEVKDDAPVGCKGGRQDGEQSSCAAERPKDEL